MTAPGGRHVSPWLDTPAAPPLPLSDAGRRQVDVLVAGAGITGMTAALLLQRTGRQVAVVDAQPFGRGVTTSSTVKVTVGHGTRYSWIADRRGVEAARAYASANVAGFEQVLELAEQVPVDCMLERGPHVVYAESPEEADRVRAEAAMAQRLGLPATLTEDVPVPVEISAAVCFDDQAQFHPGRYLHGLALAFLDGGGTLLQQVRASRVSEHVDGCHVETTRGRFSAGHVVVATHYPFLNRGGHFAHLTARRSYGIAGVLAAGVPAGMTINTGSPTRSTRTVDLGGERLLIVVGEGHPVGRAADSGQRWARMEQWAAERFGVTVLRYRWSAQEVGTLDGVPFAGFITPGSRRILVATGFDGWGMTNGTASAMLVRDLVLGRGDPWPTPWADAFDARRALRTAPGRAFVAHNASVGRTWVRDRLVGPRQHALRSCGPIRPPW